jgi:hypothetical protein
MFVKLKRNATVPNKPKILQAIQCLNKMKKKQSKAAANGAPC